MTNQTRAFILGAGFSKPAGMPLATELLPLLLGELEVEEMQEWLGALSERLAWLSGGEATDGFALNIEQVFHYAHFDIEAHRLMQHLVPVGRGDGPGTPWTHSEEVVGWLSHLEDALRDVVLSADNAADIEPITRWANSLRQRDAVLTFNYDTLVERALTGLGKSWNHGIERDGGSGFPIFKMHGSIDWIVADRIEPFPKLVLLFDKENVNRTERKTGHVEDDFRLWRCPPGERLSTWIKGRHLQLNAQGAQSRTVGIAGLGAYKELHQVPGLGLVWKRAMQACNEADLIVVVGFSMSDFDAMAQMQFAGVARSRRAQGRPVRVIVVDPGASDATKDRFRRVFRSVEFVKQVHEDVDWASLA